MRLFQLLWRASPATLVAAAGCVALCAAASAVALLAVGRGLAGTASATTVQLFAAALVVLAVTRFAAVGLAGHLTLDVLVELRTALASRATAAPLVTLDQLGRARLSAALTEDLATLSEALPGVAAAAVDLAVVVGCLAAMAALSPALFAVSLVLLALGALLTAALFRRARAAEGRSRQATERLADLTRGLVKGAKELKLSRARREAFVHRELHQAAGDDRRHRLASVASSSAGVSAANAVFLAGVGLLVFAAAPRLGVTGPVLSAFLVVALAVAAPLGLGASRLAAAGRARAALARLDSLLAGLAAESGKTDVTAPPAPRELRLEQVSWHYPPAGGEPGFALGPVELTLRAGELVFLTGGTGAGKTTLAKLVCGLYAPATGQVFLGEKRVAAENREHQRELVAAVFADSWLFDRPDVVRGDPAAWLRRLGLEGKVELRDGQWVTTSLSASQRRRLLLATAVLAERPFAVLDEWPTEQDPALRTFFYRELLPELRSKGCGVLVVSHDDRYFDVADRVLRLEDGRLTP